MQTANAMELEWTYYDYYAGSDTSRPNMIVIGSAKQLDFMKYCDVEYNGEKYRAVYYENLRPNYTCQVPQTDNSNLRYYGFKVDTVYWYKFEPVEWTYLDYENGVAISSLVLDSQPYNEFVAYNNGSYYNSTSEKHYADDYTYSSLRTWLNNDFYNTVFTAKEKAEIETGGITENDNVSILSEEDVLNTAYGFNSSAAAYDEARLKVGTDYASSQGLTYSGTESENIKVACNWRVRPKTSTGKYTVTAVDFKGKVDKNKSIDSTITGIIPVIKLKKQQEEPDVKYTITLNANGGVFSTGSESYSCEYKSGESITLPAAPTKTGYSFAGWDIEIPETMPAKSLTASAKWTANKYTITFVSNGGSSVASIKQAYGTEIVAPANPTRTGYTFKFWSPAIPATMPEGGAVCVAQWEINEYEATFDAAGGEFADDKATATVKANYGEAIEAPAAPAKTGYTFKGWTPEVGTMPVGGASFTAVYEANIYNAVFDANGGAWADGDITKTVPTAFNEKIEKPANPEKQGYVFSKWDVEPDTMDDVNGKKFTAVWIGSDATTYTVETYTMNTVGEYEKTSQVFTGTTDETAEAEYTVPTGFTLNSEKSVLSGKIKADNSLVFKVYIDRNKYAFTTVIDGTENTTEYYYGSLLTVPAAPTKNGYKFVKWNGDIPETMPAGGVKITAEFIKSYSCPDCGNEILGEDAINAHIAEEKLMKSTVTIKNNGGSKTINYGETLRLTAITSKLEYVNIYWYVDGVKKGEGETFDVKFDSGTKIVEAKLADANGNILKNKSGSEISASEKVTVKAGIWQKIVSFFKNLFGANRVVVQ